MSHLPILLAKSKRGASWTPTQISGMIYFVPGLTTCFSDAGTTPATVGGIVYQINSSYGSYIFQRTTATQEPILRQSGSGKYYLEFAATRRMTGTTNTPAPVVNEPYTIAVAFNPVSWNDGQYHTYIVPAGSAGVGQYRSLWQRNDGKFNYDSYAQAAVADNPDGTINQSVIVTTSTGAAISIYRNGSALSVSGPSSHVNGTASAARLGHDNNLYTGNWNAFGFGWRAGVAALTAGEVASLDAFQQSLYA